MPPPGIRRSGGRTYARGGGIKDGPAWKEGRAAGTQVQHNESGKTDQADVNRGPVITRATGGPVEHPMKGGMAPKFPGGAGGGEARLAKAKRDGVGKRKAMH